MAQLIKNILIVEDDLSLRPLWENFFRFYAQKVYLDWAVSCEEALKLVEEANKISAPYDIIISDIFLAGSGTGMELLTSPEVLKSGSKTILVSVTDAGDIKKNFGHLIPNTEVISKPLDFKKYKSIISGMLEAG